MNYPNIKSYREDRRGHFISPLNDRPEFLGRNSLDLRWHKYEPKVNLKKQDNIYEMELMLPGFQKEDIDVVINDDVLTIRAERKEEKPAKDYVIKEFDYDVVERTFVLSDHIGREKVTAEYTNGVLNITFTDVPPSEEVNKKTVKIQ